MPKVYIILLNYCGWRDTIACLESLLKIQYNNYEIILIDNCSPDDSLTSIQAWAVGEILAKTEVDILDKFILPLEFKPIKYNFYHEGKVNYTDNKSTLTIIAANSNRGYSAGNNIGIKYALNRNDADYFWLLNNDTIITPNSLTELVNHHRQINERCNVGIIGGKIMHYYSPSIIQCVGGCTYNDYFGIIHQLGSGVSDLLEKNIVIAELDYIAGACMLVSKKFIKSVGLLSEDYFLYFEELDWCTRGAIKGWNISYTPNAYIYHKEGASSGASGQKINNKSAMADYYYIRNKLIFTDKYKGLICWFTIRCSLLATIVNRIIRGQYKRVGTIFKLLFKR